MRLTSADRDLDMLDRFDIVVDQDAEPADWDAALADFLFAIVERRIATIGSGATKVIAKDAKDATPFRWHSWHPLKKRE